MATIDPYAACPCGSGKKFKWCCQPIHEQIVRAFKLEDEGQHDNAAKAIDEVVAAHPDNPEAYGRKAQLLYQQQKFEESEAALHKAFELNPKYAFGQYLQGRFRQEEGEIGGALILFRRAAENYDSAAAPILSDIHGRIFECEFQMNHPVAARAALELAIRLSPNNNQMRQVLEQVTGAESRLPTAAKEGHKFRNLPASASPERKQAWNVVLQAATTGKLVDVVAAFTKLTESDGQEATAWYNLGLSQAWLGNNAAAVEALDRYVALETDEAQAAKAWELAEVLRCGQGNEDQADVVENISVLSLRQPQALQQLFQELQGQNRLVGAQVSENNVLTALVLEKLGPALTPELTAQQSPHLGASLLLIGNVMQLSNTHKESVDRITEEFQQVLGASIGDYRQVRGPARFADIFSEAMIFPMGAEDQEQAAVRIRSAFERFYEDAWLHRPLKALGGVPPIDAAGSPTLRKKLRGVIDFLEDCARLNQLPYDWDRLRRKVGLLEGQAAASDGSVDVSALGAAELAALDVGTLGDEQLEAAYQAALKVDAREVAGKFAGALVERPARANRPDRFVWFSHLIQLAQTGGKLDQALDHVNAGEKDDCEHNEGRRRNDYELRRAQVQVKRGEFDQAQETFNRLIARVPGELRYQGAAAETMLSGKQGGKALAYAEKGLAGARQQNNRDLEGYFQELVSAAQRNK